MNASCNGFDLPQEQEQHKPSGRLLVILNGQSTPHAILCDVEVFETPQSNTSHRALCSLLWNGHSTPHAMIAVRKWF